MKKLILPFNELQNLNKELKSVNIELPKIVVIGAQSSGKSSVLESIVGQDLFPKGTGMVTRCPLRLQLINDDQSDFEARFNHKEEVLFSKNDIIKEIKSVTSKIQNKDISSEEIVLEIRGKQFPTLTLVDLPGMVVNIEKDQPKDLDRQIKDLIRKYIAPENTIILAISTANTDLATSEAIKFAKDIDIEGRRTIHVLTKLDILNEGESPKDILLSNFLNTSLGVVGVINRTEKNNVQVMPLSQQRQKETDFFKESYPEMAHKHGTNYLISHLEKVLTKVIRNFIPQLETQLETNITVFQNALSINDPENQRREVTNFIIKFCQVYGNTLTGSLKSYSKDLEGGVLISIRLYDIFIEDIKKEQVDPPDDNELTSIIENTKGTKDVSFSFEKSFTQIIRKEVKKFFEPSRKCVVDISKYLCDFISSVMEKHSTDVTPRLRGVVEKTAHDIIKIRTENVNNKIKEYIRSEKKDITFSNPFKEILSMLEKMTLNDRKKDETIKDTKTNLNVSQESGKKTVAMHSNRESRNNIQSKQMLTIKSLIDSYFELVRNNIINYVPKTIQAFLLHKISDAMLKKMNVEILRDSVITDIFTDDLESERMEELKFNLKKSLEMKNKLIELKDDLR